MREKVVQKIKGISWLCIFCFCFVGCAAPTQPESASNYSDNRSASVDLEQAALYNVQLSMAYLQQGNIERSQQKILLALRNAPNSPTVLAGYAMFLSTTGDIAEAEKTYQRALSIAPNSGEVRNNYGIFLCQQKRQQEGITQFLQAVQQNEYIQKAGAYENAGLCAIEIPDRELAIKYFHQALLKDPKREQTLYELSKLYFHSRDYTKAKTFIERYHRYAKSTDESSELEALISLKLKQQPAIGNYNANQNIT
jgi:type IV pilus assembly protein PilF